MNISPARCIVRKRRAFEYALRRRSPQKSDFLKYIEVWKWRKEKCSVQHLIIGFLVVVWAQYRVAPEAAEGGEDLWSTHEHVCAQCTCATLHLHPSSLLPRFSLTIIFIFSFLQRHFSCFPMFFINIFESCSLISWALGNTFCFTYLNVCIILYRPSLAETWPSIQEYTKRVCNRPPTALYLSCEWCDARLSLVSSLLCHSQPCIVKEFIILPPQRALQKFKGDTRLWLQYFDFCMKTVSMWRKWCIVFSSDR